MQINNNIITKKKINEIFIFQISLKKKIKIGKLLE